ncbi:Protein argonaute-1 [Trichinella spiralis]|uniref:Protein argonaute-1 n=1 Tax=Trichinella spiralis TaxID=6334 RepID=A0ABR3KFT4_TRISP
MSQQSQDTNLAADELSQLGLKELVKRPGYGTVGKPIKLACNYFPLIKLQKGDIVVNRYHIDIQHPRLKLNCDDNRDVFWAYVVKRSDIFGDPFKLAYDGKSTLFTVEKLHLKQVGETADPEKFSFKTVRENKPSELSILMKFTGLVHLDFRNAEAGSLDEREKGPIQFLDILFAQGRSSPLFELSKSFRAVRNSFYCIPQGAGVDVKYGIELWRGLFISARVIDGFRPAINIDVSHSCFYKRQSLINLICDILNGDEREVRFHPNQLRLNTQLQPEHLNLLIPELKGVCIHTTHRNQDRIYLAEYFRDVYGPLKYPNLPLVEVGSKSKPIYFPVELCQVANCQRYNKKLKACQTTSIIRFASTDAPTRILKSEPMIVNGRVLPPPRLEYGKGNGGRQIILTPKDGAWNSNEFKFFESASCESFGFVSFLPPHKASMLQEFCMQIVRTCRSTGIEMPDSPKFYEQARKNDTVEMVLKRIADKCDRDGIKCDLVFVALYSSEQYAQVKSCGDITFGLVTQCVLPKTISDVAIKKSYSTMLNIAMKINMKIGGINTKLLEDEILDNYLYKNNALVIGVDVVHPSAVETHLPSIASVVGNVDTKVTNLRPCSLSCSCSVKFWSSGKVF